MEDSYAITKKNYEEANDWHAEKSLGYDWVPQLDAFLKLLKPGTKVLDVGCGNGRDIPTFLQRGIEVEGLDYAKPAIETLRERFPERKFYEADMSATGLPDGAYGGVWACASVLNIPKAQVPKALAEFRRLLISGGALFISVKEGEGERMVPDKAGERFFDFFSEEEIRKAVESAGFVIDHTEIMEDTFNKAPERKTLPRWISIYAKKS